MAYISFQPRDFFNILQWTGDSGASQAQTGLGFQPDMTWIKCKNQAENHGLYDSVRGVTKNIAPNLTATESTLSGVTAFGADGFTVGASGITGYNTQTYVGWNWKAGTTSGITTNGSTTITPTSYSFNTTSGVSLIQYAGNSTAGAKIAHGLGVKPDFMIIKPINLAGQAWVGYHQATGATKYFELNTTAAAATASWPFDDTEPDTVNFTVGNNNNVNTGYNYLALCFAEKKGYSKFSSYQGNGNAADGPFVYTGFRPAFLMIKCSSATENWYMFDDKRAGYNFANYSIKANDTDAEATSTYLELLSNGFRIRNAAGDLNASTATFAYMAFAEYPLVGSNQTAALAR